MNNYFFDDLSPEGICFTVMANNFREARKFMRHYIREDQCLWKNKTAIKRNVHIDKHAFHVYRFEKDEVIETN